VSPDPEQSAQPRTPFAEATAAADSARNRGQSAWAISSALAGALIAGGVLTNGSERPWWTQLFGLLAIAAWIVTATLFISAVSGIDPIRMRRRSRTAVAEGARSGEITLEQLHAERLAIDKQLNAAYYSTVGAKAIGLTLAALIAGLVSSVAPAHIKAYVTLKPDAFKRIHGLCPAADNRLPGFIERGSLTRPFAVIVVKKGNCQANVTGSLELYVPPSAIEAFRSR